MADHEFGVVRHDCFSLHVEIPQYFVTPSAFNEADDLIAHTRTEECHGACCPKLLRIDEAQMGSRKEFDCGLEMGRDHSGGHVCPTSPRCLKKCKRGVRGGALLSEVRYSPPQGLLWA